MKKVVFPVITDFDMQLPYYFSGVGCFYEQENIDRPEGYPAYQWIQCRSGRGELHLNGSTYILEKGQGMFLFPNEPHSYHSLEGVWEVDWVIFRGNAIGSFVDEVLGMNESNVYYVTTPYILADKIAELYNVAASATPAKNLTCSSLVYGILLDILRLASLKQNTSIANKFDKLEPVLNYIEENYSQPITLEELAQVADLTPQYLCTAFKKFTSQTMFEYINMVRIRKSKELLLFEKRLQVKEIAGLVGFQDASYFCLTFRKLEKMSPTEFRGLHN